MKNKGGRPPAFKNPHILEEKIKEYFNKMDAEKRPYTMCGLAIFIDIDRKTLLNYSNKERFFPTIKKARDRVEAYAEERLFNSTQIVGVIFNLKNNFDWKDKVEQDQKISGNLVVKRISYDGNTNTV